MSSLFTENFPEAIVTKCRKCTDRQKIAFEKVAVWFNEKEPENWAAVIKSSITDFQTKAALKKSKQTA